jgi:hypothetical protein
MTLLADSFATGMERGTRGRADGRYRSPARVICCSRWIPPTSRLPLFGCSRTNWCPAWWRPRRRQPQGPHDQSHAAGRQRARCSPGVLAVDLAGHSRPPDHDHQLQRRVVGALRLNDERSPRKPRPEDALFRLNLKLRRCHHPGLSIPKVLRFGAAAAIAPSSAAVSMPATVRLQRSQDDVSAVLRIDWLVLQ